MESQSKQLSCDQLSAQHAFVSRYPRERGGSHPRAFICAVFNALRGSVGGVDRAEVLEAYVAHEAAVAGLSQCEKDVIIDDAIDAGILRASVLAQAAEQAAEWGHLATLMWGF
jgi:hypothetical protein